jgi:hypothetical protein
VLAGRGAPTDTRGGFALMAFVLLQEAGTVHTSVVLANIAVVDRRRVVVPPLSLVYLLPFFDNRWGGAVADNARLPPAFLDGGPPPTPVAVSH